jgi:hypothetical protein
MRREWAPEELIASWTLIDRDRELLANKAGATRLGFALLLRFFERCHAASFEVRRVACPVCESKAAEAGADLCERCVGSHLHDEDAGFIFVASEETRSAA